MIQFAIVGLGPWGLSVLERTVGYVRRTGVATRVHVVEPGAPGGGTCRDTRSDYLILNNACGLLSLYAAPGPRPGPSVRGRSVPVGRPGGVPMGRPRVPPGSERTPDHRRLPAAPVDGRVSALVLLRAGRFRTLLHGDRPARNPGDDVEPLASGRERVHLEEGEPITVDHVVITSGHTENQLLALGSAVACRRPTPPSGSPRRFRREPRSESPAWAWSPTTWSPR